LKTVLYYLGKSLQLIGMGTVLIAFLSFFGEPKMGLMFKLTAMGLVEFYGGYFLVSYAGVKGD